MVKNIIRVAFFALLIVTFYFFQSGLRPLSQPDEGRYAEIPREMVLTGDFVTPRLNGVKYFEKPPLFYWMQASALKVFGQKEWAVRFWNVLMAVLGIFLTYFAGRKLFSERTGQIAASLLSTSLLYYGISRIVILDMTVSVFISGAIFSMLLGSQALPGSPQRRWYFLGGYVFCGLATLTKGLIGFGIPGVVIFLWLLATRQWKLMREMLSPLGIGTFLVIVVPWHVLVTMKNPEFAWFYFVHEHFLRLTTRIHARYQPWWFFIPILLGGLFPWTLFFLKSAWDALRKTMPWRNSPIMSLALLIWVGLVFSIYSVSQSKLIPYILPLFPAAVLLIAHGLDYEWDFKAQRLRGIFACHFILAAMVSIALFLFPLPPFVAVSDVFTARWIVAGLFLAGALLSFVLALKVNVKSATGVLVVQMVLTLLTLNEVSPYLQRPSAKPIATFLKPYLMPEDRVATFAVYPQDLPFYLERQIIVAEWVGELEFGTTVEDTRSWIISKEQLKKMWHQPQRLFVILRAEEVPNLQAYLKTTFSILFQTGNYRVVCNKQMVQPL